MAGLVGVHCIIFNYVCVHEVVQKHLTSALLFMLFDNDNNIIDRESLYKIITLFFSPISLKNCLYAKTKHDQHVCVLPRM